MATKTSIQFIRPHLLDIPESVTARLEPVGTLTGSQIYDASGGSSYTPDWSLLPCPLGLVFDYVAGTSDPGAQIPTQADLLADTSGGWYYIDGSNTEQPVNFATSTMFAAVSGNPHQIQVKGNLTPDVSLTVIYRGTLNRKGQSQDIYAAFPLRCRSASLPQPRLDLDMPDTWIFNPVRDRRETQRMTARLLQAGRTFTPGTDCAFYWEIWDGSQWIALDPNEITGAEFNFVGTDKSKLDITLSMLQDGTRIRVSAAWDTGNGVWAGSPEAAQSLSHTIGASVKTPRREMEVSRKCYNPECRLLNIPTTYTTGDRKFMAEVEITEGGRVVDNPEEVFEIKWYLWTNPTNGTVKPSNATMIGTGTEVNFNLPAGSITDYGISVEAELKEPLCVAVDDTGAVLTDDAGNWLLV